MPPRTIRELAAIVCALILIADQQSHADGAQLTFCCSAQNDLYLALSASHFSQFDVPAAAIQNASSNSAVLLLAGEYPRLPVTVDSQSWELARKKNLRLFLEFPGAIPGIALGPPRTTAWERIVVSSDMFAPALSKMRILAANDCHFIPITNSPPPDLWWWREWPDTTPPFTKPLPAKEVFPILFEVPGRRLIVATTKLSGFVTGRFAPTRDWQTVWGEDSRTSPVPALFQLNLKPLAPARLSG